MRWGVFARNTTIWEQALSGVAGGKGRKEVGVTGEAKVGGRVRRIGGLKEKVLGAHRAGITTIILPKDNEADMEDIPEEVRKSLAFHTVSTLAEVFAIPLEPEGRLTGHSTHMVM